MNDKHDDLEILLRYLAIACLPVGLVLAGYLGNVTNKKNCINRAEKYDTEPYRSRQIQWCKDNL